MYLSINNVFPIDPDKAGKALTDYLNSYGQITYFSLIALAILSLIVAIVVAKKAGYSGWWGAIAVLVPPVGLILVVLIAILKWPALKERDEALGILDQNQLTLPSHERRAIKEAERKRAIEDAARKRMEKAQADREKADAQREKFAAGEAKRAATAPVPVSATPAAEGAASAVPAPVVKPADAPVTKPAAAPVAAKPVDTKPAAAATNPAAAEKPAVPPKG
ncbi:YrzE family protein [Demequina lutea]|uniref:Uncharacterized protein n=1 Tax=Demequina lutea TaxID=431489 RepID=A0A7Y9ZF31_9MICO|nr:YrzE family protein [Demequina lutea]NYI42790.1 hypothetical protein [Demequina lutea]